MVKIQISKIATLISLATIGLSAQSKITPVNHFDKVIVSPHIQVNFVAGDTEEVAIESSTVPEDKIHIEVSGKTLRIYLEGAKELTKNEKTEENGYTRKKSIYNGTVLVARVSYKILKELSLRGEETFVCESPLAGKEFTLTIYGESQVYLNKVALGNLRTTIYGESFLELKEGTIDRQRIIAYGETKVNTLGVETKEAKITAYGEGSYRLHVLNRLKVTAYGEATVAYEGNPEIDRGIIIGEATIQKIQ
jgi:hypothetical protein